MSLFKKLSLLSLISLHSFCCLVSGLELISSHFVEPDLLEFLEGEILDLGHDCLIFIYNSTFWELVRAISVVNEASELVDVAVSLLNGLHSKFLCLSSLLSGLNLGKIKCFGHFLSMDLVYNAINC
jgi:hypothetical protein